MEHRKLIAALKQLKVETGHLACLGCGYENNCGIHGCAIIREAVEALEAEPSEPMPLTLEQVRMRRGRWIWIVSPDKDLTVSGWAYVGKEHVFTYWEYERDALVARVVYNLCDYGAWLAYDLPPGSFGGDLSDANICVFGPCEHETPSRADLVRRMSDFGGIKLKEQFLEIYKQNIARPGSDKLLAWLETTDFFEAPASTRFHLSRPGGLVEHSIHVYERLLKLYIAEKTDPVQPGPYFPLAEELETITICGLLHDLCKANFYTVEMRNRKNEAGQWEEYPFYVVNDQLPYGHGEKSVYIISGFMKLTREEAMAIRWHMGFSDTDFKGGGYSVGNAFEKFPLALLTHMADLQATYLDEAGDNA